MILFFLEGGGQEEISDSKGLNMRDNLKDLWTNKMNDENKKIVWKYFKTFILLIEKYILEKCLISFIFQIIYFK